jgi:hypothetical protein
MLDACNNEIRLLFVQEFPGRRRQFREINDHDIREDSDDASYHAFDLQASISMLQCRGGRGTDDEDPSPTGKI